MCLLIVKKNLSAFVDWLVWPECLPHWQIVAHCGQLCSPWETTLCAATSSRWTGRRIPGTSCWRSDAPSSPVETSLWVTWQPLFLLTFLLASVLWESFKKTQTVRHSMVLLLSLFTLHSYSLWFVYLECEYNWMPRFIAGGAGLEYILCTEWCCCCFYLLYSLTLCDLFT